MASTDYMLSNAWTDEQRRLAAIEELYDPATFRHLSRIGLDAGWTCLEVGGGGGSVARWMATQVGPGGSVVATDVDTRFLDQIKMPNVEVKVHDLRSDPVDGRFDLIHARLVLEHLPERIEILGKLIRALKPGGWLLVEDGDYSCGRYLAAARQFVVPETLRPTMRRMFRALEAVGGRVGLDPEFGRELPRHLANGGLVAIGAETCSRLVSGSSISAAFYELSIRQLCDAYVSTGFVTRDELEEFVEACGDPNAMFMSVPVVSAWGCQQT